ncbi:MAG: tripartite tricarboxylate transporter permease [Methylobacteriaceae bacterium]|jgi:putative tricarboxylic transport membrane protein|nr:tripartite tricarboxylate transporter permease [Methylobacteriaceae bacterium]
METPDTLGYILAVFQPSCLWAIFVGVFGGTVIGALPGLTATMGVALLIPITFGMPPVIGLNMLIGIFIGGIYGGCISSILVKTPGTPASAATVLDGYPLAQKGQALKALGMATIASGIGGLFSCVVLAFCAPLLASFALKFGPAEYFSLAAFGLAIIASLSSDILKGILIGCFGMLLSTIGSDPIGGVLRFTFGMTGFADGVAFIPALIGLFAISEVLVQIERIFEKNEVTVKLSGSIPSLRELASCWKTLLRGSIIGTFVGIVPGTGSGTASWISYSEAKRNSPHPERFGTGELDGVAATESANNAVCGGALVPLLALGIPGDSVTAVLVGGLMIQGLAPGPMLFTQRPDVVIGIFTGSFIANVFMIIIGLAGVRLFAQVLRIPKRTLVMAIVMFCVLGSYAINMNVTDLYTMLVFGVVGYFLQKYNFSLAAVCIALILGPIAEVNLRLAYIANQGDLTVFITKPISAFFIVLSILSLVWPVYREWKTGKKIPQ